MAKIVERLLRAGEGRVIKKLEAIAAQVNALEEDFEKLSDEELRAVLGAAREEMLAAVAGGGRPDFSVYRRRGRCPACGGPISSRGQGDANRTTYWCPSCQG